MAKKTSKKNSRKKAIAFIGFGLAAAITYWWAYALFMGITDCDPGGSRLSLLIVPLCLTLGGKFAAVVPALIGTISAYMLVRLIR